MADIKAGPNTGERMRVASATHATVPGLVAALRAQLSAQGLGALMVFFSSTYDADDLAAELRRAYPGVPIHGCSSAGEITPEGLSEGGAVALGFPASSFTVVSRAIVDLADYSMERARRTVEELRRDLAGAVPAGAPGSTFAIVLIDGLSRREEEITTSLYAALGDIPLVGGSAGDDMRFDETLVLHDGEAHRGAAVVLLVHSRNPIRVFKCDHFEPTAIKFVVTEADPQNRIVSELNAEPASAEYARAVGVLNDSLGPGSFASHPVVVRIGGDTYVRAIQRVNEDGSLAFLCAIDEGIVLTLAKPRDMLASVRETLDSLEEDLGPVDMILGFDCVLRRLEAQQRQIVRDLSAIYRAHHVVGFSTYGEQYHSMHLNQTFTGVAIGRPVADA
jgi:hypothetical protein